uniref:Uncharacterized protein n=1 Tax=Brassica oleracea TaxID=3712 RepID=A0A3P6G4G7_BRAOL|nr:unnamed protein product [Brassica oleracea]
MNCRVLRDLFLDRSRVSFDSFLRPTSWGTNLIKSHKRYPSESRQRFRAPSHQDSNPCSHHLCHAELLPNLASVAILFISNPSERCNIPGPAQKETQVQEAQGEETLDITPPIAYKRRSFPRVQPQERDKKFKPSPEQDPPPASASSRPAPSPVKPAASRP